MIRRLENLFILWLGRSCHSVRAPGASSGTAMSDSQKPVILTDEDIRRSGYIVNPFDAGGRYVGAPLVRVLLMHFVRNLSTRPSRTPEPGRSGARIHASSARRVPLRARALRDVCREQPSDRPPVPSLTPAAPPLTRRLAPLATCHAPHERALAPPNRSGTTRHFAFDRIFF